VCGYLFYYVGFIVIAVNLLQAHMRFPGDYPYSPPTVKFLSKMWHPNVYEVRWLFTFMQFWLDFTLFVVMARVWTLLILTCHYFIFLNLYLED